MASDQRIGATLQGKYTLERVLGEGGMGIVYAARHLRLDRPVAIKLLHGSFACDDAALARFFDEARAAGSLQHRNVIDIVDVDVDGDTPFMVMERLSGEPLSASLHRRGPLSVDETLSIVDPLLDALAAAHDRGIVHRDLKPDNIFLAREGEEIVPKLLDFGIAKLLDGGVRTETGNAIGTPMYMAPEQAAGRRDLIGPWTDVWSMGVVLFECLSGQLHFDVDPASGVMAWLSALATQPPRSLRSVAPHLPAHVTVAVDSALDPDVERRIRGAPELRAALRGEAPSAEVALAQTMPGPATPHAVPSARSARPSVDAPATREAETGASDPPGPRPRRNPALVWVGALVGAAAIAAVAAAVFGGRTPAEPPSDPLAPVATETVVAPSRAADRAPEPDAAGSRVGERSLEAEATPSGAPPEPRAVEPPASAASTRGARARPGGTERRSARRREGAAPEPAPSGTAPSVTDSPDVERPSEPRARDEPMRGGAGRSKVRTGEVRTRTGEWSTDEL